MGDEQITTDSTDLDILQQNILDRIEEKDFKALKALLHDLDNVEVLYVINSLSRVQKTLLFRLLNKDSALYIFEQLDTDLQKELLESFTDEFTREIIEDLDPDDRANLLDELPAAVAKRLISMLSPEDRNITNMLMGYETETAGRIMTPEFITLRRKMTADEALTKVRLQAKDKETIYTLYVTDDSKKLEGVISLKGLLIADPATLIEDIMSETVIKVTTDTDQEEAAKTLKEFDILAIPVVDKEDRIVGIITIDDAVHILEHEATEDIYNQAGLADVAGKETNRSEVLVRGSIWAVWKVRLPFLVITLVAGLVSGSIIGGFEDVLAQIAIVAVFIPLIMDMGGNVGTQSTTIFVRGVALGHIDLDRRRFFKHLFREVGVGFSIGMIVGVTAGIVAGVWGGISQGIPQLGLAVGLALVITMTLASLLGFLVPFVLLKLKLDSAAGSSPLITSIKDMVGLTVYFVLVSIFLSNMLYGG